MNPRTVILWGLLGAVTIAAVAAVLAVLVSARSAFAQIMWTGVATAICGGLMLPLTRMLDRPRLRPAGLCALAVVIVGFLLAIALAWLEPVLSRRPEEALGLTLLFAILCGIPLTVLMLLVPRDGHRLGAAVGLLCTAVASALFLAAIWLPGPTYGHDEWWICGWATGGLGLVVAACLLGRGSARRWWRWIGVGSSAACAVVTYLEVWVGGMSEELFAVTLAIAVLLGSVNLMLLIPLGDGQRIVRWGTITAAVGTASLIAALAVFDGVIRDDTIGRLAAAGGIVTACGTLAMLILAAFNRRGDADERAADPVVVTMVCPRCDAEQRLAVGPSACTLCGLRIHIRVEEPRCPTCAYLLYKLESDLCPECGTPVRRGGVESAAA